MIKNNLLKEFLDTFEMQSEEELHPTETGNTEDKSVENAAEIDWQTFQITSQNEQNETYTAMRSDDEIDDKCGSFGGECGVVEMDYVKE